MPQRFKQTEAAIEKGLENVKPDAGIKLIEAWEGELEGADFPGAKGLVGDLEKLKKELGKDEPKEDTIFKLIGKLGAATTKAAAKADEKSAEKVRALGEALTEGGQHDEDDEDA